MIATVVKTSWDLSPGPLILLAVAGFLYFRRFRTARREARARAHGSYAAALTRDAPMWKAFSYGGALLAVFVALVSPVDEWGHQVLVMHMVQHLLLIDVAPVLAILGLTRVILRPVTRRVADIERALGPLGHPAFAAAFYIVVMIAWHIPGMYDLALRHDTIHALEHMCFAIAGGLYWWHLLAPIRPRHALTGMGPVLYMLVTKLFVGMLGIVITFAPNSIYSFYDAQGSVWGMSPHTDQATAGALMAVEQSIVMGCALAWLFVRMLGESQRADERAERYAG